MKEQEIQFRKEILYPQGIIVMKFGGSSVANIDCLHHAASIIKDYAQVARIVVVVSAMQGVTDQLYSVANNISAGCLAEAINGTAALEKQHLRVVNSLVSDIESRRPLYEALNKFKRDILIYAYSPIFYPSDRDFIVSYGERISSLLLAQAVNNQGVFGQAIDATQVIVTNNDYGDAKAYLELSQFKARAHLVPLLAANIVPIIGGFYGTSEEGRIAVLGRGGSDYSAAVLANILNARKLILWKEVDGIYSADPKEEPSAEFFSEISYDHAESLARNGAKILHPESIDPLRVKNIPIEVKNYFNPQAIGSRVNGKV